MEDVLFLIEWLHWRHKVMWLCISTSQKAYRVQWQLNRNYGFTCTPGCVAAQFNRHGSCAIVTVDTVVPGKFQAACVSKITVELSCLAVLWVKQNIMESVADVLWPVISNAAALWRGEAWEIWSFVVKSRWTLGDGARLYSHFVSTCPWHHEQ